MVVPHTVDVISYCFSGYPEYLCPTNRKWNQFLPFHLRKNTFNVIYLENGERYDDGVNGSRLGSQPWAIDWHRDI